MATTQYIGARYVPLFAEPLDWNSDNVYEALTIVYYAGNSYTSRQAVPKGIDITNEKYWALTGNYNAQIEAYRKEVKAMDGRVTENAQKIADEVTRAVAQEAAIKSLVEAEAARAKAAEKTNSDAIAAEVTRAKNAEAEITTDYETAVNTEKTRATNAENELATGVANAVAAVNTEKERAEGVEKTNSAAIAAEVTRAKNAEAEVNQTLNYTVIYLSSNGDDSNDGLTTETPMKTFDAAIKYVNKGFNTLQIKLLTNTVFESDITMLANCTIHLDSDVGGVFQFNNQVKMYNAYLNASSSVANGVTFNFNGGLHIDNSSVYSNHGIFNVLSRFDMSFSSFYIEGTTSITSNVTFSIKASTFSTSSESTLTWNVPTNLARVISLI